MNEHDFFQKTFSNLHASDDTLHKVLKKAYSHKGATGISKRFAVLVAVLVMIFRFRPKKVFSNMTTTQVNSEYMMLRNNTFPVRNPKKTTNIVLYGNVITPSAKKHSTKYVILWIAFTPAKSL